MRWRAKKEEDLGLETGLRDRNTTKLGHAASMEVEAFILDV